MSRLVTTDIYGDIYVTDRDVGTFLSDEENAVGNLDDFQVAELLNLIDEQIDTDNLVEDSFREALAFDHADFDDEDHPAGEWCDLYDNYDEIMDLCDLVEAFQKGFIL